MSMELVTGGLGYGHISADDVGHLLAGIFGDRTVMILDEPVLAITGNARLTINGMDFIFQGRYVRIVGPEVIFLSQGMDGYYRNDIIMCRYEHDWQSRIESCRLVVVRGLSVANSEAVTDPTTSYVGNSILEGDSTVDVPIIRVSFSDATAKAESTLMLMQPLSNMQLK